MNRKGLQYRLWRAFVWMAFGTVFFIGLLQLGFIRPYYRNRKTSDVRALAQEITLHLYPEYEEEGNLLVNRIVENNACVLVRNSQGKNVYFKDGLGLGCLLKEPYHETVSQVFKDTSSKEKSMSLKNELTDQDMLIYGLRFESNLETNYVYVSTALEPVDSLVSFFATQYFWYTVLALLIASGVAVWVSKSISKPIVQMKDEAKKWSKANYGVSFEGGGIQEMEELALALNQSSKKLNQIEEFRRDLFANVSHDIRTPLTNIQAYTEMLQDFSVEDPIKRKKHLEVIMKEARYMNQLVQDMKDLSQMEAGHYALHKSNVDMALKIREILDLFDPQIQEKKLQVKLKIPGSLTIFADEVKMGQVISNYLINAMKHSPEGASIEIRLWRLEDEETMRFEVEDHGEGISPEDQENIWNRYQKASKSFSRSTDSTGLGLAIVKAILEAHGAKYGLISEQGKGSTFYMEYKDER